MYNFAQSFVSNYKISFSAKIIKGFRSKGNFAVFIAVQTNFYLIQSDKMPSFLLHTGGGNLPDTGQKTGGRHFNLPDSDQNMFSQPEKVELLKTNNEKSFNSNLIFLPTSAGTTQSAPRTRLGSGFRGNITSEIIRTWNVDFPQNLPGNIISINLITLYMLMLMLIVCNNYIDI